MTKMRVVLLAGMLTLFGVAPVGAQFVTIVSSSPARNAPEAAAPAQTAPPAATPTNTGAAEVVNKSVVVLPCIPVAAYWTGPPRSDGMPPGPDLAIVSIKARPKNTRVYLDNRFVGRARYLDGTPGYLYLEPGTYGLELRYGGYRTVAVELKAAAGCKFVLKHYLERDKGEPKEGKADGFGKGKPFERVFSPVQKNEEARASATAHGPDPSLRLDFTLESGREGGKEMETGASLRLRVDPTSASVSIDGVFVATGEELAQMENPLAMAPGPHLIEVEAPGFVNGAKKVDLDAGETLELEVTLSRARTQ